MPNYKSMYFKLFNKITDTIKELQEIQQQTEEIFLNDDSQIIKLPNNQNTPLE